MEEDELFGQEEGMEEYYFTTTSIPPGSSPGEDMTKPKKMYRKKNILALSINDHELNRSTTLLNNQENTGKKRGRPRIESANVKNTIPVLDTNIDVVHLPSETTMTDKTVSIESNTTNKHEHTIPLETQEISTMTQKEENENIVPVVDDKSIETNTIHSPVNNSPLTKPRNKTIKERHPIQKKKDKEQDVDSSIDTKIVTVSESKMKKKRNDAVKKRTPRKKNTMTDGEETEENDIDESNILDEKNIETFVASLDPILKEKVEPMFRNTCHLVRRDDTIFIAWLRRSDHVNPAATRFFHLQALQTDISAANAKITGASSIKKAKNNTSLGPFILASCWGRRGTTEPGRVSHSFSTLEEVIHRFNEVYTEKTKRIFTGHGPVPQPGKIRPGDEIPFTEYVPTSTDLSYWKKDLFPSSLVEKDVSTTTATTATTTTIPTTTIAPPGSSPLDKKMNEDEEEIQFSFDEPNSSSIENKTELTIPGSSESLAHTMLEKDSPLRTIITKKSLKIKKKINHTPSVEKTNTTPIVEKVLEIVVKTKKKEELKDSTTKTMPFSSLKSPQQQQVPTYTATALIEEMSPPSLPVNVPAASSRLPVETQRILSLIADPKALCASLRSSGIEPTTKSLQLGTALSHHELFEETATLLSQMAKVLTNTSIGTSATKSLESLSMDFSHFFPRIADITTDDGFSTLSSLINTNEYTDGLLSLFAPQLTVLTEEDIDVDTNTFSTSAILCRRPMSTMITSRRSLIRLCAMLIHFRAADIAARTMRRIRSFAMPTLVHPLDQLSLHLKFKLSPLESECDEAKSISSLFLNTLDTNSSRSLIRKGKVLGIVSLAPKETNGVHNGSIMTASSTNIAATMTAQALESLPSGGRRLLWDANTPAGTLLSLLVTGSHRMPDANLPSAGFNYIRGIPFTSLASTAAAVATTPMIHTKKDISSFTTTTVLMLCEVAVGVEHRVIERQTIFSEMPNGTHSIHAVGRVLTDPQGDQPWKWGSIHTYKNATSPMASFGPILDGKDVSLPSNACALRSLNATEIVNSDAMNDVWIISDVCQVVPRYLVRVELNVDLPKSVTDLLHCTPEDKNVSLPNTNEMETNQLSVEKNSLTPHPVSTHATDFSLELRDDTADDLPSSHDVLIHQLSDEYTLESSEMYDSIPKVAKQTLSTIHPDVPVMEIQLQQQQLVNSETVNIQDLQENKKSMHIDSFPETQVGSSYPLSSNQNNITLQVKELQDQMTIRRLGLESALYLDSADLPFDMGNTENGMGDDFFT